MQLLEEKLLQRKERGNFRILKRAKNLIDFGSNDTLGLARCPLLKNAVASELAAIRENTSLTGFCSTGSRLLAGNHPYAEALEESISLFHGYEAGILFNCGYMANLGLITAIAGDGDNVLFDARIHASTRDGIGLCKAKSFPFRHNDLNHLEMKLKKRSSNCYVCIESVYSTDGSMPPLQEMQKLCERYGANLIIDETHAIGIYGPQGRGLARGAFAVTASFGKALGAFGAIILGSEELKSYLINFAHSLIYTTALPLQNLAVIKCAYERLPKMEEERKAIQALIPLFSNSPSHIQPIYIPGNKPLIECAHFLEKNGFNVAALRSPTVRRKEESLRISLHAYNSKEQALDLLRYLQDWKEHHG